MHMGMPHWHEQAAGGTGKEGCKGATLAEAGVHGRRIRNWNRIGGGVVKAEVVVVESGRESHGNLWLAGGVTVARTPGEPGDSCWHTVRDGADRPCAQIDGVGNLTLQGLLYVNSALVTNVSNWPFQVREHPVYEW